MSSFVPFVNSRSDVELVKKHYAHAPVVRVSLASPEVIPSLQRDVNLWLDSAFDAYHSGMPRDSNLSALHRGLPGGDILDTLPLNQVNQRAHMEKFCGSLLNECLRYKPKWISVPQLPVVLERERHSLNRTLAKATGAWRTEADFRGSLILPLLITHQDQVNRKPNRDKLFKHAKQNLLLSSASAIWIVDVTLTDSSGSNTLRKRFANIIDLHERFVSEDSELRVIAGPYWGLNILLWAKGLAHFAGAGTGRGYQYFLPGSYLQPGHQRIALGPLRRLAVADDELKKWLSRAARLQSLDPRARMEFEKLASNMAEYVQDRSAARQQVANFYGAWCATFENLKPEGRSLALYQDLSQAFVIGSCIKDPLPRKERPATKPGQVAEQLMLNCL